MKIGQTVYLKPTGNAARRSSEIKEAVISKVGSKYFEVEPYGRFNRSDQTGDSFFVKVIDNQ